jgi:ABC-type multidrug transport system fused ATPase/permease subunit
MLLYIKQILVLLDTDRRKLPWLVLLFVASSMLDLLGLGLIGPYTVLVVDQDSATQGFFSELSESIGLSLGPDSILLFFGFALLLIFFFKLVTGIAIQRKILQFSARQRLRLQCYLLNAYQFMPYTEYLRRNSSAYIYNISAVTGQFAGSVVRPSLKLLSDGIVVLVITAMLAWQNFPLMLILLILLGSISVGYDRIFRRKLLSAGKEVNEHGSLMVRSIQEGILGLKEIRILGKERYFFNKFQAGATVYAQSTVLSQLINAIPRYLLEFILVVFSIFLIIVLSTFDYSLKLMLPTLAVFGVAALRLVPTVNGISSTLVQLRFGRNGVSRLFDDFVRYQNLQPVAPVKKQPLEKSTDFRQLTVSHINFRYPGSKHFALRDISFDIHAGESIGIIGASGSGKTTLVDVILGLLAPEDGELCYNSRTLNDVLTEWRSQIAYLPQDVFLIDGTLLSNVALGIPEKDIDKTLLFESLRLSRLLDLVDSLPHGIDTNLGERGLRVSGGQKQRIALARAFYHGRNVLVLDEATSALDYEIELEIMEEIALLKGKKTLIVIAHRLTTLQSCEKIIRLKNGCIVQMGDYSEVVGSADNLV